MIKMRPKSPSKTTHSDKIPEYEDFLTKTEKLEWIRSKPAMRGTPWENFKQFLSNMRSYLKLEPQIWWRKKQRIRINANFARGLVT